MSDSVERQLKVEFAPNAVSNLEDIEDFVRQSDGAVRATRVIEEILERCSSLSLMPRAGRARPELGESIRSVTSNKFVIYYRLNESAIQVLRVWHGHRDVSALREEFLSD